MKRKYIPKKISVFLKNYKWLLAVIAIQFILVNHFLPISEVFNVKPIIDDDYPLLYYNIIISSGSNSRTIVIDPFFGGGIPFPINFLFAPQNKFVLSPIFALPLSSNVTMFKMYIFIFNVIFPLVVYLSALNFGFKKSESIVTAALAVLFWNFERNIHQLNYIGIPFTFESYMLIFAISFFYKLVKNHEPNYFLYFSIFSILLIVGFLFGYIHLSSFIFLSIPFSILTYKQSKLAFKILVLLTIICAIVFLQRFMKYIHLFEPLPIFQSGGLKTVINDFKTNILQLILILGFYGIFAWKRNEKLKFMIFLPTSIFCFVFSYFGSLSHLISYLEPMRFLIPLNILLVFPLTAALYDTKKFFNRTKVNIFTIKNYLVVIIVVLLVFSLFKTPEMYSNIESQFQREWNRRLTTDLPEDVQGLIFWIKGNTTPTARILVEDSLHKVHQYGGHNIALFPLYTQREFIGGPYPSFNEKIPIPNFNEGILFNKNVTEYSPEELNYYFNIYNIKWIICWSNKSRETFDRYNQSITKLGQIGRFSVYETGIKPTFFIKGTGEIAANLNNIEITNASHDGIIIKYRYFKDFNTEPMLKIEEYKLENISTGFISVFNENVSSFKIYV